MLSDPQHLPYMHRGPFTPSTTLLESLIEGLLGATTAEATYLAPSFFLGAEKRARLLDWLQQNESSRQSVTTFCQDYQQALCSPLAFKKAAIQNHYALCKQLPREMDGFIAPEGCVPDVHAFLDELASQWHNSVQFLSHTLQWSPPAIALCRQWIADTAGTLFLMGYVDNITHSAQVMRLSAIKAKYNAMPEWVQLQAALVGWLHDPKLATAFSLDNLATHPIMASAIALHWCQHPTYRNTIDAYLKGYCHSNAPKTSRPCGVRGFIRRMLEALSINNDSRYINENIIFEALSHQLKRQYCAPELIDELWDMIQQRIAAPSQAIPVVKPSGALIAQLPLTHMDSGFIGLPQALWERIVSETPHPENLSPQAAYQALLEGQHTRWSQLAAEALWLYQAETGDSLHRWLLPGQLLLSHHQEVILTGRQAAYALACADPLMLSPHKILEVRPTHEPFLEKLQSFVGSLDSNINDLPHQERQYGLSWQRALYLALLQASQALSPGAHAAYVASLLERFSKTHRYTPLQSDVDELRRLVLHPSTWQGFAHLTGDLDASNELKRVYEVVKSYFLRLCADYRDIAFNPSIDESKYLWPLPPLNLSPSNV